MFGTLSFPSRVPQTTSDEPPGNLGLLSFLVGGTWVGQMEDGVTVKESCTWGPGKSCILTEVAWYQDAQITRSGHGLFFWNPETSSCVSTAVLEGRASSYFQQAPLPAAASPPSSPLILVFFGLLAYPSNNSGVDTAAAMITITAHGPNEMSILQQVNSQGQTSSTFVTYQRRDE